MHDHKGSGLEDDEDDFLAWTDEEYGPWMWPDDDDDDDDLDFCAKCGAPWELCECDDDPAPDFVGAPLAPGAVFHVLPGIRPETLAALRRMAELVRGGALS